jgi:hypothetical protein
VKAALSPEGCRVSEPERASSVLRRVGVMRQRYNCEYCRLYGQRDMTYGAVTEGEACDSEVVGSSSPATAGFKSPSSCFGITAGAVLCGVASSVASLAAVVSRAVVAPPLAPARARVLPLPLGFGGIML